MAEIILRHTLFYDTEREIPAWQVAEALLALQSIARRSSVAIESLYEGTTVQSATVFVQQLTAGSLTEQVLVKLIYGSQEKFDEFIARERTRLGLEDASHNKKLLATLIILLTLAGCGYALGEWHAEGTVKIIQVNQDLVINVGADSIGVSPGALRSAVEAASAHNRSQLANDALRLIQPARGGAGLGIQFDSDRQFSISPETVEAMPGQVFPDKSAQSLREFDNVAIEVRATDLDSSKRGWGVMIPSVSNRRLPMEVGLDVNPFALPTGATVTGNVTVSFDTSGDGPPVPKKVFLRALVPITPAPSHLPASRRFKTIR